VTGAPRPPYAWAAGATAAVFALYASTLAPTTAFWDTSEYIATSHILGIPHPPGNPLFVLLGRTWELLLAPLGLPVAVRINLFSAAMSAAAHGLWFLVVHELLGGVVSERRQRLLGAAAAVVISATAFTVWNQSNVNEKVYTVSLFTVALLTWLALRWRAGVRSGGGDRLLVLVAFILALSVGNHLMAFLAAPALAVFVFTVRPASLLRPRLYGWGVLAVLVGLSVHLFLPLRSALHPTINEAEPTCESTAAAMLSVATWGQAGCDDLSAALRREQYDKPPLLPRQAPLTMQVANFVQYLDWQWSRSVQGENPLLALGRLPFTLLFLMLCAVGLAAVARHDRQAALYGIVLLATLTAGLVVYLNFKYGYSFATPGNDRTLNEVRERDYFFLIGFSVFGLWAGVGLCALWQRLAARLRSTRAAAPVLLVALVPGVLNAPWAERSGDYAARDWAYNLLMSVEPYGVLFTNGDNDTFPLWYLQEVEGLRRDVIVVVTSYLNTPWYARQIRDLSRPCGPGEDPDSTPTRIVCQRPYDPSRGPAAYVAPGTPADPTRVLIELPQPIRAPSGPVLDLDDATIDGVTSPEGYFRLDRARSINLGAARANLPADMIVLPWHQLAMAIIARSLGDRPVYFASSGTALHTLGLEDQVVRQGLAYRLVGAGVDSLPGVHRVADDRVAPVTGRRVDVGRTATLVDRVFVHRGGIPDAWAFWPDRPSAGIPNYYAWAYAALTQAALEGGDAASFARWRERLLAWQTLGR